jgi:hypothetical protein
MRLAAPAGILLAVATAGLADEAPAPGTAGLPVPAEGARVRLELAGDGRTIVGTLRRIEAGSLLLDVRGTAEPVAVDRRAVARLSLSTGTRRQTAKGAVLGAVIGFGVTLLAQQAAPGLCPACSDDSYWTLTTRVSLFIGAPLGAAIGAAAAPRTDVWTPAELPPPGPGPVAITIRF